MIAMTGFCDDPGVIQVFLIIKKVIDLIKIAVPIGLIVMVMLDFARGAMSDEKASKETIGRSVRRIIAAVVIFFVPFIINLVIDIIATSVRDNDNYNQYKPHFTDCWTWATQEYVNLYNDCLKDTSLNRDYCWCKAKSANGGSASYFDEICRQQYLENE